MATNINYRRQQKQKIQDNGPRWEGSPNAGGHGIAKGRKRFKKFRKKSERRKNEIISGKDDQINKYN